ncbi:type VII secretion-associated serine protease mycosin [Streptomyces sp. NPDC056347]|uniref:type VII secretion-associated serine protease mycosin n=1 Tax=Streptomyces sp. NPDC056347 TaxID=3345790 RepID=UPI0035E34E4B
MRTAHRLPYRRTLTAVTAALLGVALPVPPAGADDPTRCTFASKPYPGRPWSLQRVLLDELWRQSTGAGVRVAVIDTGVDIKNPQLKTAVDAGSGRSFLRGDPRDGTTDTVGHGTKVAGVIAAREAEGTGFTGLAPDATIIPIRQNDARNNGTAATLAEAVHYAADTARADVINISQDTSEAVASTPVLEQAVNAALDRDIVIVASAGNDGLDGRVKKTYPASYEGVLAVAASDRDNERAAFSQSGDFVDVAAPGVDIVSTVPGGGHCADSGTSFSAPYAAGVAALIRAKHPDWTRKQVVAQIEQTAERSVAGRDRLVGWGVVDPVRALTEDERPLERPVAQEGASGAEAPAAAAFHPGETADERTTRLATYAVTGVAVLVAALAGIAVAVRDGRRRTGDRT